ncbi:MAG TPA: ABC transporter ATP-binding protein [Lachnospiraceae bacterium]|nr:ABC transporter ATP-binding protein [Lachnospiraceae bacterium]
MELRQLLFLAAATITATLLVHLLGSLFRHNVNYLRSGFWEKCEMVLSGKMMEMDYADVESARIQRLRQQIQDFSNTGGEGIGNVLYQFWEMVGRAFTVIFSVSFVLSLFTARFQGEASGILAFAVSPAAAVLLAAAVFVNAFAGMDFGKKMMEKSHVLMRQVTDANRIYTYYLENHIMTYHTGKDVRIYNQKGLLQEETQVVFDAGVKMVKGQVRNEAKYSGAVAFSIVALSTLVCLFVGLRALAGMIGVGELVLYIGSISRFTDGFTGFVMALTRLRTNNDAMRVYFEFLNTPVSTEKSEEKIEKNVILRRFGNGETEEEQFAGQGRRSENTFQPIGQNGTVEDTVGQNVTAVEADKQNARTDSRHEVEFRDVSFRYPAAESWALRHLSMKFRAGERLAVVGRNGSGKTTFIKLLCRLYDPTEGSILLDGVDIREYGMEEYRKLFSVVFQDYKLFSFSLAQNVAARMDAEPDRVSECLERAGFGERLAKMPSGIHTCLYRDFEETGVEISGGEAQKIALARALYKDAPIVILDEPTAALDPIAEYEIYSRFNEMIGDKTAIYISHRLSSCRFCDDIAVFHMGELVQRGSHDELVADAGGVYYELWDAQAQHYVAD